MRIVGGRYRGRVLAPVPRRGVRPTADPVREALFNILGEAVVGRAFLDLCAGTGAVGLEALSRGADPVILVERDRRANAVIGRNLSLLQLQPGRDPIHVVRADVGVWLRRPVLPVTLCGPVVAFIDPPYGERRLATWVRELVAAEVLGVGSLLVVEQASGDPLDPTACPGLRSAWRRRYGDTALLAAEVVNR